MKYRSFKDLKVELLKPINYYYTKFDKNFKMLQHAHPYFEIMYCCNGSFSLSLLNENNETKTVSLFAQDYIFIDAGIYHEVTITEKCNVLNLEFCTEHPAPGLYMSSMLFPVSDFIKHSVNFSKITNNPLRYFITHDEGLIMEGLKKLINLLNDKLSLYDQKFLVLPSFYALLGEMGKNKGAQFTNKSGIIHIKKALEYIHKNFYTPITATNVAEHIGINRIYLQRLFKAHLNQSILKTINFFRIEHACNLLKSDNVNINQIWRYSGFNSRQHFYYEFMTILGIAPSEYRKNKALNSIYHSIENYEQDILL